MKPYLGQHFRLVAVKINTKGSSKTRINIYRSVRPNLPEDVNVHNYCCLVRFDFGRLIFVCACDNLSIP
jgi:hypothetical protein